MVYLGINTEIILYNGTTKKVQDILPGDTLMGYDNEPETVSITDTIDTELFVITQSKGDTYTIGNDSKVCLFVSSTNSVSRKNKKPCKLGILGGSYSRGDKLCIQVSHFVKLSKTTKCSKLKGYKVAIDFPKTDIDILPFIKNPDLETPNEIYANSRENKLTFLGHIIDFYGNLTGDRTTFEIRNPKIGLIAKRLACTLGFSCKFLSDRRLLISGYGLHEIPSKEKAKEYCNRKNYMVSRINVEALGEGKCIRIETQKNSKLLLHDCTVVS